MLCSTVAIAPCAMTLPSPSGAGSTTVSQDYSGTSKSVPVRPKINCAGDVAKLSDEALMLQYRDTWDTAMFQELVRRYHGPLYRFLCGYLGNSTLAEDVLQNTLLKVHLKCGRYQPGRPVRPWLYKIATRQAIDALRRAGRFAAVSLDQSPDDGDEDCVVADLLSNASPDPLDAAQSAERRQLVRESVARLPEPFRQVVRLAYFRGMTYSEIADALKIPLGTVKSRLHLAIGKLQRKTRASHFQEAG